MNYCALLGLLLSVVTTALIIAGAVLPHFVDVFIVEDPNDPDGTDPIAGVGVFSSEYDSSVVDPVTLARAGAPDDKFTTPTLEFPLLFPGQQNFVAEVLPIDEESTASLELLSPGITESVVDVLDPIRANAFTTCDTYIPTTVSLLNEYFNEVNPNVFPKVVAAVNFGVAGAVNAQFAQGLPAAFATQSDVFLGVTQQVLAGLAAAIGSGCEEVTFNSVIDAQVAGCLGQGFAGVSSQLPDGDAKTAVAGYASFLTGSCTGVTILECHGSIEFVPATEVSFASAISTGYGTDNDFCSIINDATICDDTTTVQTYLTSFLVNFYTVFAASNEDLAPLVQILSLADGYFTLAQVFGVDAAFSTALKPSTATFNPLVYGLSFPTAKTDRYDQCNSLAFLQVLSANNGLSLVPNGCTLEDYFNNSLFILSGIEGAEEAVDTMGGVATLYNGCFEAGIVNVADCSGLFAFTFLNGAYNGDIGEENFVDPQQFIAAGISECDDDVVDNDKIKGAQKALISSFVFYGLGLIMGGANVAVGTDNAVLLSLSGLSAIFAGVLTIGSLLIVQSAPVYEGVGEPSQAFEAFFQEGSVVNIAISAAIMSVIGGGCYLVGSCLSCKAAKASKNGEEGEEAAEEKKAPKADIEAKTGKNVEIAEAEGTVAPTEKDL